jgi:ATP-dependent Clp protease ATP-binding subunit ClpA
VFEHFTSAARGAVLAAQDEARAQGSRQLGTEHLLVGVLMQPGSRTVPALGLDGQAVRGSLAAMDAQALAMIGIDVHQVGELLPGRAKGHLPLTAGSRAALTGMLREARSLKQRELTPEHLLLALLERERPDPAAEVLHRLGIDVGAVRRRLTSSAGRPEG